MIRRFFFLLFLLSSLAARAQEIPTYYELPHRRINPVQNPMRHRWYLGLEGFLRSDQGVLTSSLGGLITSQPSVTKASWSVLVGYSYRDRWNVEAGYARAPIHNQLTLVIAPQPYDFTFKNESHAAVIRLKAKLFSTTQPKEKAGFWLTGGAWLVPNSGKYVDGFIMEGYRFSRFHTDTISLLSQTHTAMQVTPLLELGVEYNVRLSNRLEMGFYGRKLWGFRPSIYTDLTYSENNVQTQTSKLTGNGTGWSFGLALRYTYSFKRTMANVYALKGRY
ncbi:hypothetical protein [Siphonobacter sp. SORGH_AS_1065]|uniref:hypothetical protein n=1 Tax=Siphonobacter sp. SORGH_AS_1065 TaxID=3041795 RepID=UPI00277DFF93|nr:hypothetical protein [Siphonobacter sp. SORGH_AS_1065]MDQ1089210.1 hypothetical protein [Siphonobacter sp. SORGH_AS_1065]